MTKDAEAVDNTESAKALLDHGRFREAARVAPEGESGDDLNLRAGVLWSAGDHAGSLGLLERARAAFAHAGDLNGELKALANAAAVRRACGDLPGALEALECGQATWNARGRPLLDAAVLGGLQMALGTVQMDLGAPELARGCFEEALHSEDPMIRATATLNLAELSPEGGEAPERYRETLALARRFGWRHLEAAALLGLGKSLSDPGAALEAARAGLALAEAVGCPDGEIEGLLLLGRLQTGDAALAALRRGLALSAARPGTTGDFQRLLVPLLRERGELEAALDMLTALHAEETARLQARMTQRVGEMARSLEMERARHLRELAQARVRAAEEGRQVALRRAEARERELALSQQEVVTRLALAAEYRDDVGGEHTWRVGEISRAIATAMGWDADAAGVLASAARLHDVGKIGICDEVLLHTGPLSGPQWSKMRRHAEIGAHILSGGQSELLRTAEAVARSHHERWDGSGYPQGLAGTDIPLVARIVAVADVYDALVHERPYKPAWTVDAATEELQRLSGHHFDPEVVEAALRVLPLNLGTGRLEEGSELTEANELLSAD